MEQVDAAISQQRVAFQFARLYAQVYRENMATSEYLADFEKKLDDIVIKI